jgi:hypothetical protein
MPGVESPVDFLPKSIFLLQNLFAMLSLLLFWRQMIWNSAGADAANYILPQHFIIIQNQQQKI